jgi:hypothetical protein
LLLRLAGKRINPEQAPEDYGIDDGDIIEAQRRQLGGSFEQL